VYLVTITEDILNGMKKIYTIIMRKKTALGINLKLKLRLIVPRLKLQYVIEQKLTKGWSLMFSLQSNFPPPHILRYLYYRINNY